MSKTLGYILTEAGVESKPEIIQSTKQYVRMNCILQEGDVENRNRRIYPTKILQEAIKAPYIVERLKTKSLLGECGHPLDQSIERQMTIDMSRASHIITDLKFDRNLMKGVVETANTRIGRDMKGLVEQGCKVAFSFRGMAPIKTESGKQVISNPMKALTWDWVLHPSHVPAYMENVIESAMITSNNEDIQIALTESNLREFLSREGVMHEAAETFLNCGLDEAKIGYDGKMASIKHGQTTARLFLEQSTIKKLDEFMARAF
jgi:hypothetical protein